MDSECLNLSRFYFLWFSKFSGFLTFVGFLNFMGSIFSGFLIFLKKIWILCFFLIF